ERQRVGRTEHLDLVRHDLDLAGGQLGVLVPGRTGAHRPGHHNAEFGPEIMSHGFLTAPHHLHDAAGVPEVDEDNAAVVPAPRHPAGQHHVLTGVRSAQRPRLMGADHRALPFSYISSPISAYSPRRSPDSAVSPVW